MVCRVHWPGRADGSTREARVGGFQVGFQRAESLRASWGCLADTAVEARGRSLTPTMADDHAAHDDA